MRRKRLQAGRQLIRSRRTKAAGPVSANRNNLLGRDEWHDRMGGYRCRLDPEMPACKAEMPLPVEHCGVGRLGAAETWEPSFIAMIIRPEQPGDEEIIHDLTVAAFAPMSFSNGSEAPIIAGLRKDGDLTVSLVAVAGGEIVGHVAFSPVVVSVERARWYGLGPVSVRPDRQRRGIGSALIEEGLLILKARGAKGCVLVGDPNYYGRFGFRSDGHLRYRDVPAQYVQALPFTSEAPGGQVTFSPAFER